MALTKTFKETILARVAKDPEYRDALLSEAVNCFLSGEMQAGKSILRDFINATIGFEALSREIGKPSKSLHRMLSSAGNPNTKTLFEILAFLQKLEGIQLVVKTSLRQDLETHQAAQL